MRVVITGSTGFIGARLSGILRESGAEVVSLGRHASADYRWEAASDAPAAAFEQADAVIHLAGEPVMQRWTAEARQRMRDSRVIGTERLIQGLSIARNRPKTLICASAVGYYGDRGEESLNEHAEPGTGFLPGLCREWEATADLAQSLGMQVVKVRIGIVLGENGGALKQMLPPFKAGVGGRVGSGRQWMPWIHIDDICGIFSHALDGRFSGVLNGTAPGIVRNAEFTSALAARLHRPAILPVPRFALKIMFGEVGGVLVWSQRVVPEVTVNTGYGFRHPELGPALASLKL
jgi:uncharacterized protein